MIYLQVTEREARELIRGVQDTNPELARVLRRNVDRQTGFAHPAQIRNGFLPDGTPYYTTDDSSC